MPDTATTGFWDWIDAVYVINLDHRTDRWEQICKQLPEAEARGKLHRITAYRGVDLPGYGERPWFRGRPKDKNWAARAGCTLSHRAALAAARQHKVSLILEDDALILPEFGKASGPLAQLLQQRPEAWDICYLGFTNPWGPYRRISSISGQHALYRIFGCSCAHAYLVTDASATWMHARLPDVDAIWPWISRNRISDRWFRRHLSRGLRVTCVDPGIAEQYANLSDITPRHADYANDPSHRSDLPLKSGQDSKCFAIAFQVRRILALADQCSDWARSPIKRWRGF